MDHDLSPITLITSIVPEAEPALAALTATLTVLSGATLGAVFRLDATRTLIGRGEAVRIALEDDSVSRQHACIRRVGDHYELEDLSSTNGTFIGGARVQGRTRLPDGARIRIANCTLRFAVQDALEADASQRIYEMSVRDALTGMYNRRHFDERLRNETAFALRHGTQLCVILCDIDHFKRVNDTLGHPAGDEVLRRVATALNAAVRTEDVIARYGGEEFVVIARGIDIAGARAFAERMRMLLECTVIVWQGKRIPVTASFGIAHNRAGGAGAGADALLADADKALYVAKRAGRNRSQLAESPGRYSGVEAEAQHVAEPEKLAIERKRRREQPTARTLVASDPPRRHPGKR